MLRKWIIFALLTFLASGCSKDTAGPEKSLTPDEVAGRYETTTYILEPPGQVIDVLALGGFIELILNPDLTSQGRFFLPDTLGLVEEEVGGPLDVSMEGTYRISGDTLRFEQQADTFVRDLPWIYENGKLKARHTFSEGSINVELTRKQAP